MERLTDRATDSEHADLHIGPVGRAGTGGGSGRDSYRRGTGSARVFEPCGGDGGEVFERPVCEGSRGADVQDGGCGEMAGGRERGVFRTERRPGKDTRIPDRVGRDRSDAGETSGSARGGSDCAGRGTRREAFGGVLHGEGGRRGRGRSRCGGVAETPAGEAAGVYGAGGVCAIGADAADAEREAGPQEFTVAGCGCLHGAGVRRAAGGDGEEVGGDLGGTAEGGAGGAAG